jgi:hypothetical protein
MKSSILSRIGSTAPPLLGGFSVPGQHLTDTQGARDPALLYTARPAVTFTKKSRPAPSYVQTKGPTRCVHKKPLGDRDGAEHEQGRKGSVLITARIVFVPVEDAGAQLTLLDVPTNSIGLSLYIDRTTTMFARRYRWEG